MSKNKRTRREKVNKPSRRQADPRASRHTALSGAKDNYPGQHFISDKRLAERMAHLADSYGDSLVLDIGAGKGALTFPLAAKGKRVAAIENDTGLADALRSKAEGYPNLKVIEQNALRMKLPNQPFCVVSNIPFAITTPIMGMLLDFPSASFQGGVLIVELGAAYRFTADPIVDPRILGWRMQYDMKIVQNVSPQQFSPSPRVHAAILKLTRRSVPLVPLRDHARFIGLACHGLRDPKMPVSAALGGIFTAPQLKALCRHVRIDRDAPVCSLDVRQWAAVFETMRRYVDPVRWPRIPKRI